MYYFSSACLRWCCPCCIRGEPEEPQRVKVAYGNADENVNLLKSDEVPENTAKGDEETTEKPNVEDTSESSHDEKDDEKDDESEAMEYTDENGMTVRRWVTKTVTTTSTKTSSDDGVDPKHLTRETLQLESGQGGGGDTDDDTEVMEYVDENGRRVRRIVKKTITTTSTRTTSNNGGPSSVTTETREISSGGNGSDRILINFGGGMPRPSEEHSKLQSETKPRAVQEKEVFLQFGSKPPAKQESQVKVEIKGQPFQKHDINMFGSRGYTTITTDSSGGNNHGNNTVYQRSVVTKTIGGGGGGTKVVEHSTKTSGHGGEHPIVVVKKEKSQINMPEWMDEKSSPGTTRRNPEPLDISAHLKYPSGYAPKKKEPESRANESKIHAEVAKRDKPVISMLSLEDIVNQKKKEVKKPDKTEEKPAAPQPSPADEEDEDEDEEEEDGEYDEFEEEIVVMDVRRKARFPKGLEIPKPEAEKGPGIPIEDLLDLPTIEAGQESAPGENLIDEKIESEERQPTVYSEPNFEELFQ